MESTYPQAVSVLLRLIIIFSFGGFVVADNSTLSQKCLSLNGLSPYVLTTMLQDLCAVYVKLPAQLYANQVPMCNSIVKAWGAVCRVGFITTLADVVVLINGGLIKVYDKFYVGLIQTNTSGAAGDGWSWDDFNGMKPATPLWATGEPTDTNNTENFAAYAAGNGLIDVNNNTFVPTGFLCQCGFPGSTTSTTTTLLSTNIPSSVMTTLSSSSTTKTATISTTDSTQKPSTSGTSSTTLTFSTSTSVAPTTTSAVTQTSESTSSTSTLITSPSTVASQSTTLLSDSTSTRTTTSTTPVTSTTSIITSEASTTIPVTTTSLPTSVVSTSDTQPTTSTSTSTTSNALTTTPTSTTAPATTGTTTTMPTTILTSSTTMTSSAATTPITTSKTNTITSPITTASTTVTTTQTTTSNIRTTTTTTTIPTTTPSTAITTPTTTSSTTTTTPTTATNVPTTTTTATTPTTSTSTTPTITTTTTTTTTTTPTTTPSTTTTTPTTTFKTTQSNSTVTLSTTMTTANLPSWNASCVVQGVDPRSQVSSQASRSLGASNDCKFQCIVETSFSCEAFTWAGPGTPCFLWGKVDTKVALQTGSKYYLTDRTCITPTLTQVCGWQKTQSSVQGKPTNIDSMRAFKAVNQKNCETLCVMNIIRPKCGAYAYASTIPFFSGNNCYLFAPLSSDTSFVPGVFDLYQYNC